MTGVSLDPFQTIVGVGWPNRLIGLLSVGTLAVGGPLISVSCVLGGAAEAIGLVIEDTVALPAKSVPVVPLPIDPEAKNYQIWKYPTIVGSTDADQGAGCELIFNSRKMSGNIFEVSVSFSGFVRYPHGDTVMLVHGAFREYPSLTIYSEVYGSQQFPVLSESGPTPIDAVFLVTYNTRKRTVTITGGGPSGGGGPL